MRMINSKKLVEILDAVSQVVDVDIDKVVTDSRAAKKGDLFIAVKGENFDGHDFVKDAIDKGVELVIVEKIIPDVPATRQIVVPCCLEAFGKIGTYNRSLFQGKVIGLTGSAGKTTTKEEIKFVLSRFGITYATKGNFNNHVGVPFSLCDMDLQADYAVIEMGMSSKGEISNLVAYTKPDIAIVTNVYPMHIEFFDSFEGIAEAKAEIFEGLKKGGTAIINEDANFADILQKRAKEHGAIIVGYGKKNIISVVEKDNGNLVEAEIGNKKVSFELSEAGEHHIYNALCTLTVVDVLGLDIVKAAENLKDFGALDGRGRQWQLKFAKGEYILIDDSYSGQPESMKLAIETLGKTKTKGRKIAVLGKMAELGNYSEAKHIEIGQALAKTDINIVVGVKPETKALLAQLPASMERHYFENKEGLDEFLLNKLLQNNDTVLIKGARYSSELYKIAESLIKNGTN